MSLTKWMHSLSKILLTKVNSYMSEETLKINQYDKPFITKKLKVLKRKRMREYAINGKSKKYLELKKEFDMEFLQASKSYLKRM